MADRLGLQVRARSGTAHSESRRTGAFLLAFLGRKKQAQLEGRGRRVKEDVLEWFYHFAVHSACLTCWFAAQVLQLGGCSPIDLGGSLRTGLQLGPRELLAAVAAMVAVEAAVAAIVAVADRLGLSVAASRLVVGRTYFVVQKAAQSLRAASNDHSWGPAIEKVAMAGKPHEEHSMAEQDRSDRLVGLWVYSR